MMNLPLLCLSIAAGLCSIYVVLYPRRVIPVFLVWVAIADLGKRLLWLQERAEPTFLEYNLALLLPDVVLMAGAGRLIFDCIRRKNSFSFHWLDLPVGLFVAWSMINVLNPGKSLYVGLAGFKSFQLYALVYLAVRLYPGSPSEFVSSLKYPVVGISLVAALYGLYQTEWGFTDFEMRWLSSGISRLKSSDSDPTGQAGVYGETLAMYNIVRIFSTFASHEQFGFFLGFVAILLFAFSGNRYAQYSSQAVLCLMLMRTLSRSSWVFTLSAAMVLVAANFLSRKNARSIFALTLAGWMTGGYFFWNYYTAWRSASTPPEAYTQRALTVGTFEWRVFTFQSLIADPEWRTFFGNGTGSMWYAWRVDAPGTMLPTAEEIRTIGLPVPGKRVLSHVGTVDMIYEQGILGFLIFFWLVILVIRHAVITMRSSGGTDALTAGIAIFLGIILANSTVSTVLIFRPISVPFWLSLGLITAVTTRAPFKRHDPSERSDSP